MKKLLSKPYLYLFFFCASICCYAQNFHLKITGSNKNQTQIIDSLNYTTNHPNVKSLFDEIKNTSEKLSKRGYIDNQILTTSKTNDSAYAATIDLNKKINYIHIYIGANSSFFNLSDTKKDTLIIPYEEIENFLNQKIIDAEKKGFALSKIKLENIQRKKLTIYADLSFKSEKKRNINSIIINYQNSNRNDYFPKGHLKQLNKKYLNKTFNQEVVKELHDDINNFEFVTQTKYPEILFTNDSTKIYVYIEKRKANSFDGYIGFSNEENKKTTLNGYLDISLLNTLHAGEQFSLYWKSDGNQQKTFNTKIEIPYIFNSALGLKAQLNIFKQDSTFQNTKTAIDLGYYINYNSKIYLGYQSTESSDIQNTNNTTISDFKNSYLTSTFDYKKTDYSNNLFSKKTYLNFLIGYGKRGTNNDPKTAESSKQFYGNFNFSYNFELNKKNFIYINSQNLYLKSKNYITNELFRFGGLNSIRGFSENSLQGNTANLLITEYRYLTSQNLYLHSILDYGIYQDQTSIENNKKFNTLLSVGVGFGLLTKNGLLKLIIANGSTNNAEIKFYNSILNICYNVKF
ncbi:ShlB/FhaC/HecB family hemolysin secretion/activation protein [uncultured Flavobacterium sp.]|uniref:ShlB/FhaC/HecB family hemolysin secretion/activation protein n=1 Tax=uncultured Flavobacterium sp. TaxID=165435 RepID=UPI00292FEC18|nr:ShlB/FhaC/HecB family hemolysin secretion/activation protein [uncultured Flavobacterium sp.]